MLIKGGNYFFFVFYFNEFFPLWPKVNLKLKDFYYISPKNQAVELSLDSLILEVEQLIFRGKKSFSEENIFFFYTMIF